MAEHGLNPRQAQARFRAGAVAAGLGAFALIAAGVALWAAEGGSVFLASAFAAAWTCF